MIVVWINEWFLKVSVVSLVLEVIDLPNIYKEEGILKFAREF